ncbi:MAG: hypothetical protein EA370_03680 [Wenzhouxiangella sp.]|nr:MAG: hypothetical protein EA370_03680 [Wenzhouxiangella sp.]
MMNRPQYFAGFLWALALSFSVSAEISSLQVFALSEIDEGGATHAVIWRGDGPVNLRVRSIGLPDRIVVERAIEDRVTLLRLSGVPGTVRFEIFDQDLNRLAEQQAEPFPFGWQPDASGIGPDRPISSAVIYQDELIVGGQFTAVGEFASLGLARFDGYRWLPFGDERGSGLNIGTGVVPVDIRALAVFNGDLHAAGFLRSAGGQDVGFVARHDGSDWHPLGPAQGNGVNGPVWALLATEERLYVAGDFSQAGAISAPYLAAWDGKQWSSVVSSISTVGVFPPVRALAEFHGDLYVGGAFSEINGVATNNLARFDGSQWHPLEADVSDGVNSQVNTMLAFDDHLIVAGRFSQAGDEPANRIAAWDGQAWGGPAVGANAFDGEVLSLAILDERLAAAGEFTDQLAFFNPAGGWKPPLDLFGSRIPRSATDFIVSYDNRLFLSGTPPGVLPAGESVVDWYHPRGFWAVAGERFETRFVDTLSNMPRGFFAYRDTLLIGGGRMWAENQPGSVIFSSWDGQTWRGSDFMSDDETFTAGGPFYEFLGELYMVGNFTSVNGQIFNSIARFDGEEWHPLPGEAGVGLLITADLPGNVVAMTEYQGDLIIGGRFNQAGGQPAAGLARWDGETLRPFSTDLTTKPGGTVMSLAVVDGILYAAGNIGWSAQDQVNLARFDGQTWLPGPDSTEPRPNTTVRQLVPFNGEVILAGLFTTIGGEPFPSIARFDGQQYQSLNRLVNPPGGLNALTGWLDDGDRVLLAGTFALDDGTHEPMVIAWDGQTLGDPLPDIPLLVEDSSQATPGLLTRMGDQIVSMTNFRVGPSNSIHYEGTVFDGNEWRLLRQPDAMPPPAVNLSVPTVINAAEWFGDGVMLGGDFSRDRAHLADYLVGFDGESWQSLAPEQSPNGEVLALRKHAGWLYVGGRFSHIGEQPMPYLARWDGQQWEGIAGLNDVVWEIEFHQGDLYVGGQFTEADGAAVNRVARHDGQQWHALTAPGQSPGVSCEGGCADPVVWALKSIDTDLVVGGRFVEAGNTRSGGVARWDGQTWFAPWTEDQRPFGEVRAFDQVDGQLLVASTGVAAPNSIESFPDLMRWTGQAWEELGGFSDVGRTLGGVLAMRRIDEAIWIGEGARFNFTWGSELRRWEDGRWTNFMAPSDNLAQRFQVPPRIRAIVPWDNGVAIAGEWAGVGGVGSRAFSRWFPEPAQIRIESLSAPLIPSGESVTVVAVVEGEVRRPRGGVVVIESDNGASCEADSPEPFGFNRQRFHCELSLEGNGQVMLSARFVASRTHDKTVSEPARILVGVAAELFQDRFQGP